ncbi:MAG: hypothetical protein ACE5HI_14600, partial [bacterium]
MKIQKPSRRKFVKAGVTFGVTTALIPEHTLASILVKENTPRWGMLIDLRRCYGCKSCAIACKAEFDTRLGVFKSNVIEHDTGKYPIVKR